MNTELLQRVLDWAQAEYDATPGKRDRAAAGEWNQANWCGTSHCIAGHTALLEGWSFIELTEPAADASLSEQWKWEDADLWRRPDGTEVRIHDTEMARGDERLPVGVIARRALGVGSESLFYGDLTLPGLWGIARSMTAGAVTGPTPAAA